MSSEDESRGQSRGVPVHQSIQGRAAVSPPWPRERDKALGCLCSGTVCSAPGKNSLLAHQGVLGTRPRSLRGVKVAWWGRERFLLLPWPPVGAAPTAPAARSWPRCLDNLVTPCVANSSLPRPCSPARPSYGRANDSKTSH